MHSSSSRTRTVLGCYQKVLAATGIILPLLSAQAAATVMIVVNPPPSYIGVDDHPPNFPLCANGKYTNCKSEAHIDTTPLDGKKDEQFKKSFDAWNKLDAPLGGGNKWLLNQNGGPLPLNNNGTASTLTVFSFVAQARGSTGGVKIDISWDYTGGDKRDFVWTQALHDNYELDPVMITTPKDELDVSVGSKFPNGDPQNGAPPRYPFQDRNKDPDPMKFLDIFHDEARAPWPNAFFDAHTFLAKVGPDPNDPTKTDLTIYEGVNYKFELSADPVVVPGPDDGQNGPGAAKAVVEPPGIASFASGLGLLAIAAALGRRRQSSTLNGVDDAVKDSSNGYPAEPCRGRWPT
jgi:hypothetical protein